MEIESKQPFDYAHLVSSSPFGLELMAERMSRQGKANTPLKRKVLVAMSGGVDSSVAAALLLRDGYEVTGAFMKQWSNGMQNAECRMQNACTWKQDRRDALRVAAKLDIPLITLDFEKEYKQWVMDYMFREYESGRTPNPDVLCNKYIKFGVWLDTARRLGFKYLATGHYARIKKTQKHKNTKTQISLLQARDKEKDQTYFLHQLTQAQLAYTLFPIGDYLKSEVRSLARKFKLPTAERAESMGICFVGEVPMKEFLMQKIKPKPGKIVTTAGKVIGEHEGLAFYTVGQRHFGSREHKSTRALEHQSKPLYVVGKHLKTNELVVGHEDDPALYRKEVVVSDVNWISGPVFAPQSGATPGKLKGSKRFNGQPDMFPLQCKVRLRHRQPMQNAECRMQNGKLVVDFEKPQRAVTPGQFAVFYRRGQCLGGGVIQ